MIILNKDIQEEDCPFKVSKKTKNYLISFFGFYRHDMNENFNEFLSELGVDQISTSENLESFEMGDSYALEAYNVCDRRTFDVSIVLPHNFDTKKEALTWFDSRVKNSEYILKSQISEIDVVDGDQLLIEIKKRTAYRNKIKEIDSVFKKEMTILKNKMLETYSDEESKKIVADKFRSF